jgi:RNA polymerase sigma factor (sigma-70 family)
MTASPEILLQHIRRLAADAPDATADAALLARFLSRRDGPAFAALVARHGPMVLRLCQRVLGDPHAAEDAFQAAFLVLARQAASIRRPQALAAWLHGDAYRVALKARAARARRRCQQLPASDLAPPDRHPDPLAALTARELLSVLDEEVQRLPEVYRLPVLLCCLEGRTQEEAARQLGWTPGSLQGRLERGRRVLRSRLTRRGLSLAAALLATSPGAGTAAAVPAALVAATARAATTVPGGRRGPAKGFRPRWRCWPRRQRKGSPRPSGGPSPR